MNVDQAREILEDAEDDDVKMIPNHIFLGMGMILMSLNDDNVERDWCSVRDKTLYYGDFKASVKEMSEYHVRTMEHLGWFEDEDCWAHFVD